MDSYRKADSYSMICITYEFDWSQLAEHNLDSIAKREPCNNGFPRKSMTQAQKAVRKITKPNISKKSGCFS